MPDHSSEYYAIERERLILCDPELGLAIEEPFALPSLPFSGSHPDLRIRKHPQGRDTCQDMWWEKGGQRHGQWQSFDAENHLLAECFYSAGVLHGPSRFYSNTGQLLSVSWFCHGLRQGKMRQYYLSGALYCLQPFLHGLRTGIHLYYYPDGTLRTSMQYSEGLLEGEMLLYWPHGQRKRRVCFTAGKKCDFEQFYAETGTLSEEISHVS